MIFIRRYYIAIALILSIASVTMNQAWAQSSPQQQKEEEKGEKEEKGSQVNWLTMEEANKKAANEQRKIFVFITTDWCKWCQRMKKNVFSKNKVINQLNDNYYAVKIQGDDDSKHKLVYSMLEGRVVYPTSLILSEKFKRKKVMQGYYSFSKLYPILVYYGGL